MKGKRGVKLTTSVKATFKKPSLIRGNPLGNEDTQLESATTTTR